MVRTNIFVHPFYHCAHLIFQLLVGLILSRRVGRLNAGTLCQIPALNGHTRNAENEVTEIIETTACLRAGLRHVLIIEVQDRITILLICDLTDCFVKVDILFDRRLSALKSRSIEILTAGSMHINDAAYVRMGDQEVGICLCLRIGKRVIAGAALHVLGLPADRIVSVEIVAERMRSCLDIDSIIINQLTLIIKIIEITEQIIRLATCHHARIFRRNLPCTVRCLHTHLADHTVPVHILSLHTRLRLAERIQSRRGTYCIRCGQIILRAIRRYTRNRI